MSARWAVLVAVAAVWLGCGADAPREPAEPSLVVISIDTLRPDHLPSYGYDRPTAPGLEKLGEDGLVFDNAFSHETNTNPAHATLFTGLYPHVHGNTRNGLVLPEGRRTLADVLRAEGFRTGGFVSGFTMKTEVSGLERGFEHYDDHFQGKRRDGAHTIARARRWLAERDPDERIFLFVHLYDVHGPYRPPVGYRELFRSEEPGPRVARIPPYQRTRDAQGRPIRNLNDYVDRYDAMIRYADDLVAELLSGLDLERTVVVILSDHGETLGERYHPLDHGSQVFEEQLRIPLLMRGPGVPEGRVQERTAMIDLTGTLLGLLGVEAPADFPTQGRDLTPLLQGESLPEVPLFVSSRAVPSRHRDRHPSLDKKRRILAVREGSHKLILYPDQDGDRTELYDLATDPEEKKDLSAARPEVRERLLARLKQWHGADEVGREVDLPPELQEQLEALGYVDR